MPVGQCGSIPINTGGARSDVIAAEVSHNLKHLPIVFHSIIVIDRRVVKPARLRIIVLSKLHDFFQIERVEMKLNVRVVKEEIRHRSLQFAFVCFDESGNDISSVADDRIMCYFENGRIGIGIDGDNFFRLLHAGAMLDGAGNSDRKIELGTNGDSGLPNLPFMRNETGIDRRPAARHFPADRMRKLMNKLEAFFGSHPVASGNDDRRPLQVDFALFSVLLDEGDKSVNVIGDKRNLNDLRLMRIRQRMHFHHPFTNSRHLCSRIGRNNSRNDVAPERRSNLQKEVFEFFSEIADGGYLEVRYNPR